MAQLTVSSNYRDTVFVCVIFNIADKNELSLTFFIPFQKTVDGTPLVLIALIMVISSLILDTQPIAHAVNVVEVFEITGTIHLGRMT